MIIPVIIPANNNPIVCDTWWQYILTLIGGTLAVACLLKFILFLFMNYPDIEDILKYTCGITVGTSAALIGLWSAVTADETGIMMVVSYVFFIAAALTSLAFGIYELVSYCKKHRRVMNNS